MINITRDPEIPKSLETPEIQKYINDLENHLHDPATYPDKPKVIGEYRTSDLLEAFDNCFFSKCYLTEQWFPSSYAMDVEHFVSQTASPALRYTWSNLLPAEHRANKMKPRNQPAGGYMDPCDENDDVENDILYSLNAMGQVPDFDPRETANIKAVNTAKLLRDLHYGHNEETKLATSGLRHEIHKKYDDILNLLIKWQASTGVLKHQYTKELQLKLSRRSSFTMLIRSMVAVQNHVPPDYMD